MPIPSSPERVCPAATVPKAEAKGEPASRHLPLSHTPRRLPHHAHHPASCKAAPPIPTLPARQEGPGPPLFSQVASARLPKTLPELVTKSKLGALPGDNKWGGFLLHAHAVTSYSTGQHTTTHFRGRPRQGAEHCRPCYCFYHEHPSSSFLHQSFAPQKKSRLRARHNTLKLLKPLRTATPTHSSNSGRIRWETCATRALSRTYRPQTWHR